MNTSTTSRTLSTTPPLRRMGGARTALAALTLLALAAAAPPLRAEHDRGDESGTDLGYDGSYSYVRALEGSATLVLAGDSGRDQAELNQPILTGDHLWVAPNSRAEVLLSDGNLLRLDGDSEAAFEKLAFSPDAEDRSTTVGLRQGNAQIVVVDDALGDELPRIETPNATVFLNQAGNYRVTTLGGDWTEVVVRSGYAEVVTDRGSVTAERGESIVVDGDSYARASVRRAGAIDGLERWGEHLNRQAADVPYVDDSLRYAAAPLSDYGHWTEVGGSWGWRPAVAADWRPYWRGRWMATPAGLTWVSYEPWGWVPYHYGSWDYAPGYGWVWFPGNRFATSWVYWYWGPSYVAWVPVGYYTRHYYPHYRSGFRFGVYGWAGGDWNVFADWTFCSTGYFGHRYQSRYLYSGRDWRRHGGHDRVPRGIITTDTRGIDRNRWHRPDEVMNVLSTRPRDGIRSGRDLPDVTSFVARRDDLPPAVRSRVLVDDGEGARLAGTPLAPGKVRGSGARDDRPRVAQVVKPRSEPGGGVKGAVGGAPETRVRVPRKDGDESPADRGGVRVRRPEVDAKTPAVGRTDDAAPRSRTTVDRVERPRARDDEGVKAGSGSGDSGRAVVRVRPSAPSEHPNRVRSDVPVERARPPRPVDRGGNDAKERAGDTGGRAVVRSRPDGNGSGGSGSGGSAATPREPSVRRQSEPRKEPAPRTESKPDAPPARSRSQERPQGGDGDSAVQSRPAPGRSSSIRSSTSRGPSTSRTSQPTTTRRSSSASRSSAYDSGSVRSRGTETRSNPRGAQGGSYARSAPRTASPPARSAPSTTHSSRAPVRSSQPSARSSQPPSRSSQPSARSSQPPSRSSQPSARSSQGSAGRGGGGASASRSGGARGSSRESSRGGSRPSGQPRKPHGG